MNAILPEDFARLTYRRLADAGERLLRSRLVIRGGNDDGHKPTVYFLTPDFSAPSGGVRVIYRHVDLLNDAGMTAFVLHHRRGFRCRWFANDTQVTDLKSAIIRRNDLLVITELDVDLLPKLSSGMKYAIFNQNAHLTWRRERQVGRYYAPGPDLAGVMTVSEHNKQMLLDAFPGAPVRRLRLGIDTALFNPSIGNRPKRIAYMPRRRGEDARQLLGTLEGHPLLDGWEVVALDGLTHSQVADQLRQTRIFLAFTYQEGFGLPAAEAMACGAYVIGNHGHGGAEFFRPEFSASIESGNIMGFRTTLLDALEAEHADPDWCRSKGIMASAFIRETYSQQNERADVLTIYSSLLAGAATMENAFSAQIAAANAQ